MQVTRAPAPVAPAHVSFTTAYIVVRGDGLVKIFDTLLAPGDDLWSSLSTKYVQSANGRLLDHETILIPLDIFSACRLGLVSMDELELPEGAKALLNIIK